MAEEDKDNIPQKEIETPQPDADTPQEADNPQEENNLQPEETDIKEKKKVKHHLIKPAWLRIPLKILMWLVIIVLLIPVLLYVPPVQTLVKNVACSVVRKSTGMDISIDRFRLKWPVDLSLQGVTILEATGDTMVNAKELVADVKLAPLLKLDVQINRLDLIDGYYRMVSPDSSMILKLNAGFLTVDNQSSADIKNSRILLNKALLKNGTVGLYMNVWKQQNTPKDTTSTPFYIAANDLKLENFSFRMSMLPTIDTLVLNTDNLAIRKGVVNLADNLITADYLGANTGDVTYLTPTPEYIAIHPAPAPDTTAVASPPMVIKGDTVELKGFKALYAVKDAEPLPGFDPSYIQVSGVEVALDGFYNASSNIKLPIKSIAATERSGLQITEGSGTVAMDSAGLSLDHLYVRTPYSSLSATAGLPFALMNLQPSAPVNVEGNGSLGLPDIEAFMPDFATYTRKLPQRSPLNFEIGANGTLDNVKIPQLDLSMPGVFSLSAEGEAADALDIKKLRGNLTFDGSVSNPGVIDNLLGNVGFKMPSLKLKGRASASAGQSYTANFSLLTSAGDVAADGKVSLTAETYKAQVGLRNVNVAHFMPTMGVGPVTAKLTAVGAGFDPTRPRAHTDIHLDVASLVYEKQTLRNIIADVKLDKGVYSIEAVSDNEYAQFRIDGNGTVAPDLYTFDIVGQLHHLDLEALGLTPDANSGHANLMVTGSASPNKWIYNVDMTLSDMEWTMGNQYIALPGTLDAVFRSDPVSVMAQAKAKLTQLDFHSETGLKKLLDSFTVMSDTLNRQMKNKFIDVDNLQRTLPPFTLAFNASGSGAVGEYINTMGMSVDTIFANVTNDSIISARIGALDLGNSSMRADTLTLNLSQRPGLIDYKVHMGNRRNNPIAEFADVNLNGYFGNNRLLLSLTQKNQKGETGYRLGMTGAYLDSVATIHFTPLKATIAYLPWQFNDDNHIEYNLTSHHIVADLSAKSKESSILLQTQIGKAGNDELRVKLDNIRVQDFLQMSVFAPPITASVNADLNVGYTNSWIYGGGDIGVSDFSYDHMRVGDFDLGLRAGRNNDSSTGARATLKVDGADALSAKMMLVPDSTGNLTAKTMGLELTRFPLRVANAFLGADVARLSGYLNGDMAMTGSFSAPLLNGHIDCDSVGVYLPMLGADLAFGNDSITVADNVIRFNQFDVWGANNNPLVLNGTVDARKFSAIAFDLDLNANNFQLMNTPEGKSDISGRLFLDLKANAKGPMSHFNVNADVNILQNTDVLYTIATTTAQQITQQDASGVVKFVNFNDTTQVQKTDTVAPSMAMRIVAGLNIEPGTQISVNMPGTQITGSAEATIHPSGELNYFQNFMGDMRLNGQLNLGQGKVKYALMKVKSYEFKIEPSSYVHWSGDVMNPMLSINCSDDIKASVNENGNSRLVNFLVTLDVSNNLSAPKVLFDLSANDDMSIQNDLMSMSADQRSMAAINLMLTGTYANQGAKTVGSNLMTDALLSAVAGSLNSFLANHIKGVDLTVGANQYNTVTNGQGGSSMSYSYQMSKSLFDNRFKISVGGNYTTDASADENFSENLISDISFEYIIKQTNNLSMYARLFRHTGYESILEGEVTETGVGFVMRRRLNTLMNLFNFLPGRHKDQEALQPATRAKDNDDDDEEQKADAAPDGEEEKVINPNDSINEKE